MKIQKYQLEQMMHHNIFVIVLGITQHLEIQKITNMNIV